MKTQVGAQRLDSAPGLKPTEVTMAEETQDVRETSLPSRNGECVVKCGCDTYAFSYKADGYDTCVCHHTHWAHAVV